MPFNTSAYVAELLHTHKHIGNPNFILAHWVTEMNRLEAIKNGNLLKKSSERNKLEDDRQLLILSFLQNLATLTGITPAAPDRSNTKKYPRLRQLLGTLVYGAVLPMGLALHSVASFLGIQKILLFIPAISNPVSLAISTVLALANAAIFYSFESSNLKRSLGVEVKNRNKKHYDTDAMELDTVKKINALFRANAHKLSPETYKTYASQIEILNINLLEKKSFYDASLPPESKWTRIMRKVITGVNAVIMAGSSYFMATSLLAVIAAPLVGTPVGFAIVIFGVMSSLISFAAMRSKTTYHLLNPVSRMFQENKTKFNEFEPVTRQEIDKLNRINFELPDLVKENTKLKTITTLEKHIFNKNKSLNSPPKPYSQSLHVFYQKAIEMRSSEPKRKNRRRFLSA